MIVNHENRLVNLPFEIFSDSSLTVKNPYLRNCFQRLRNRLNAWLPGARMYLRLAGLKIRQAIAKHLDDSALTPSESGQSWDFGTTPPFGGTEFNEKLLYSLGLPHFRARGLIEIGVDLASFRLSVFLGASFEKGRENFACNKIGRVFF